MHHIKDKLPDIKQNIEILLKKNRKEVEDLGTPISSDGAGEMVR
jgi:hypothetical protein